MPPPPPPPPLHERRCPRPHTRRPRRLPDPSHAPTPHSFRPAPRCRARSARCLRPRTRRQGQLPTSSGRPVRPGPATIRFPSARPGDPPAPPSITSIGAHPSFERSRACTLIARLFPRTLAGWHSCLLVSSLEITQPMMELFDQSMRPSSCLRSSTDVVTRLPTYVYCKPFCCISNSLKPPPPSPLGRAAAAEGPQ
jgi:hypothetical protein